MQLRAELSDVLHCHTLMTIANACGIYEIRNLMNGKRYIGSALRFATRWGNHRSRLRKNTHHSPMLQAAWNKYGEPAFEFKPLLICAPEHLIMYEQRCLDGLKPEYNVAITAGNRLGLICKPETRAKIAAAHKGKRLSLEHRAAIGTALAGCLGRPHTEESRAKMSAQRVGNTFFRGRKHRPESIEKMRAAKLGKVASAETRLKQSMVHRGNKSNTGRKLSAEHRARISAGLNRFYSKAPDEQPTS